MNKGFRAIKNVDKSTLIWIAIVVTFIYLCVREVWKG